MQLNKVVNKAFNLDFEMKLSKLFSIPTFIMQMYINIICHLGNLRYDIKDNHLTTKLYKKIESSISQITRSNFILSSC